MKLSESTLTLVTISLDVKGCPSRFDLVDPINIGGVPFRTKMMSQKSEATLRGQFNEDRFDGNLAVPECKLRASVRAAPRR